MVLLSFDESLACNQRKVRPTLIDLNHVELRYNPFLISLDKCGGSCNVLSPKICVQKTNNKVFNMITNKNEAKKMAKHI